MKRKLTLVIILLLLLAAILFLIPLTEKKSIEVNAGYVVVTEQFSVNQNLAKWIHPLSNISKEELQLDAKAGRGIQANNLTVTTEFLNPLVVLVQFTEEKKTGVFQFQMIPDETNTQKTSLLLSYKTNLFEKLRTPLFARYAEESLQNLKSYMEDVKQFYGYDMQVVKVTDTAFLVSQAIVKKADIPEKANELYNQLISFAEKTKAGYYGIKIFHKERTGTDEFELSVGIAVTKMFPVFAGPGIEFKQMPMGKNLLMCTYVGLYGEIEKAYEAMEKFKQEHSLSSMAIPFERLPEGASVGNDDEMVRLQIFYPIF
jgi:hypothetical protein